MFVLTRYLAEGVVLHRAGKDPITIRVLDILGNRVKLGFDCSDVVTIDREEIYASLEQEEAGPEES